MVAELVAKTTDRKGAVIVEDASGIVVVKVLLAVVRTAISTVLLAT